MKSGLPQAGTAFCCNVHSSSRLGTTGLTLFTNILEHQPKEGKKLTMRGGGGGGGGGGEGGGGGGGRGGLGGAGWGSSLGAGAPATDPNMGMAVSRGVAVGVSVHWCKLELQ